MVTPKTRAKASPAKTKKGKAPVKKAKSTIRSASKKPVQAAAPPAVKATKARATIPPARKAAASGKGMRSPAPAVRSKSAPRAAAHPTSGGELLDRVRGLQQEKAELHGQARAELDSALAEAAQLRDKVRARDSEESRGAARQEEPAGPGEFDPAVDLEDDLPTLNEDDLEGAAGFFDRMDEIRARRNELDRERNDRELEQSEQSFWMSCPKCGDLMEEQESENVKLERCENCGGLYLDRGEVDLLLTLSAGAEGMRRLHNMLKF